MWDWDREIKWIIKTNLTNGVVNLLEISSAGFSGAGFFLKSLKNHIEKEYR